MGATLMFSGTLVIPDHPPIQWRAALAIEQLIAQVHAQWPAVTVGVIGDATHIRTEGLPSFDAITGRALSGTDHLPDIFGRVCACDLMNNPGSGFDALAVGLAIAASCDPRLGYMEAENLPRWPGEKRECSRRTGYEFVEVGPSGAGPHLHVSVLHTPALADSRAPWAITDAAPTPAPPKHRKGKPMFFFVCPDAPADQGGPSTQWVSDGLWRRTLSAADAPAIRFVAGQMGYDTTVGKLDWSVVSRIPIAH